MRSFIAIDHSLQLLLQLQGTIMVPNAQIRKPSPFVREEMLRSKSLAKVLLPLHVSETHAALGGNGMHD